MSQLISLEEVGIVRGDFDILSAVSFSLTKQDRLAVVGPNGAGKSFLLRVLSADLVPSFGKVTILGKTFGKDSLWDLRRVIGFVSTRMAYEVDRSLSVLQLVCSGFRGTYSLPELPTDEEVSRAMTILRDFKLDSLRDRRFGTLSDGESRKALLCRALVNNPQLLIFDEPCQGLDIGARDRLLHEIDRLALEIPIIYVAHHVEELPGCINRVMLLKEGKVIADGTKEELLVSDRLSGIFDISVLVKRKGNRYYVEHE